jgi:hypothetical protein
MSTFETPSQRNSRRQAEENERVLNENIQYADFFNALIDIFGQAQELVPGEFKETQTQSSAFNNVLASESLKSLQNEVAAHQGKPLQGLYAMIMQRKTVLDEESELPAPHGGKSAWKTAVGALLSGVKKADDTADALASGAASAARRIFSGPAERNVGAEIADSNQEALNLLNFPEYYVYIFADVGDNNPIPKLLEERELSNRQESNIFARLSGVTQRGDDITGRKFANLESYQQAIVTSKAMREEEEIAPGSIVRISYDNADTKNKVIINEVIENDPQFVELVLRSLGARAALTAEAQCSTDSVLVNTVHSSGDPIGELSDVSVQRNIGGNNTLVYPFKENATVNLVVFFHGIEPFTYDGQRRSGQDILLASIQKNAISSTMFLVPRGFGVSWSAVQQAITDLESKGIQISSKRLGAWSAGSQGFVKALEGAPSGYFDGGYFLADPSPNNRYGSDFSKIPNGVYMEYNPEMWNAASVANLKARFPAMVAAVESKGGQAILKSESHAQILDSIIAKLNT